LNAGGSSVFNRDQDSTSVRTIMRTSGVDDLFHEMIIVALKKGSDPYSSSVAQVCQ
jgi:hypothetical protein